MRLPESHVAREIGSIHGYFGGPGGGKTTHALTDPGLRGVAYCPPSYLLKAEKGVHG